VVNYAEAYEPRHTFVYDLFNAGIEAKETLWGCPSCHKCEERCPYDFRPLELVKALKEVAFAAGLAPQEVYAEFDSILNTGGAFPVSSATRRQRAKLGLPELPDKPVSELAIIAERTGLAERLAAARGAQQARMKEGGET
jgi:heterodisulfide reductase subunit C